MDISNQWASWFTQFCDAYEQMIAQKAATFVAKNPSYTLETAIGAFRGLYWWPEVDIEPIRRFSNPAPQDISWLSQDHATKRKRQFLAALGTQAEAVPDALLSTMLSAAIEDHDDKSFKKFLIEPCGNFGNERITQFYVEQFASSSGVRRRWVLDCLYFAGWIGPVDWNQAWVVWERKLALLMTALLSEPDADIRRDIVQHVAWNKEGWGRYRVTPEHMLPLLQAAIDQVEDDPDPDIRKEHPRLVRKLLRRERVGT
jgi:hypothetical protein